MRVVGYYDVAQGFEVCKVWVCTNYPIRVSPWHHKLLQNFCTMREIVSVILLILLILWIFHNPEPHHNTWPPACRIMYLCPIIWLPVYYHIHWKTQIDPMNILSVPSWYGLISTYEIQRIEYMCVILIKTSNKVFNKFPPMSLMAFTLILHIWLMAPLKMPPQHIKTVTIHTGFAKIRSRPVLWLRDSRPQAGPVSKLETCS